MFLADRLRDRRGIIQTCIGTLVHKLSTVRGEMRANRRLVVLDIVLNIAAMMAAVVLAVGPDIGWEEISVSPESAWIAALSGIVVLSLGGLYRRHVKSSSLRDLRTIVPATLVIVLLSAILHSIFVEGTLDWNVFAVQFFVAAPLLGMARFAARRNELRNVRRKQRRVDDQRVPTLVVGTGPTTDLLLRSLRRENGEYDVIGVVDDARNTTGLYFHDVPIVGSLLDADQVIAHLKLAAHLPRRLILTEPVTHLDEEGTQMLLAWAEAYGVKVSRMQGLGMPVKPGSLDGEMTQSEIEPETVLHRPPQSVERTQLRDTYAGRRVLVTGAGGSIGSELCRQIASLDPAELVMLDICELNCYTVDMDLGRLFPKVPRHIYVADVRDEARIRNIMAHHKPDLVFNAAALKHVPMVENNPCEGVLTNIIGARNVADAARANDVGAMVQVSTDKAVNSTNVMGASKRVAEFYCQANDRISCELNDHTRFFSVRFGNVLGSSGSLVPLFQQQIAQGGPLTVTDARMERYFMTIREAVELTLLAAAEGLKRSDNLAEIFVLDMGKPVKIVDLARRMIRMAGKIPDQDIKIKIIGIRPGEKLFEELFDETETPVPSGIPGILSATPVGFPIAKLRAQMRRMEKAAHEGREDQLRIMLAELLPGYAKATGIKPAQSLETELFFEPPEMTQSLRASSMFIRASDHDDIPRRGQGPAATPAQSVVAVV